MKSKISAKIVADSLNPQGDRITTMEVVFPRMILAELNTHRMFSKNSTSSRAVPFNKMVYMVRTDPFIPIAWQKTHKGMQGDKYAEGFEVLSNKNTWLEARDSAVKVSKRLSSKDVTKQLCNRLLEPFMWHKVLVTATEWDNFFNLRCHPQAEIHMQALAESMRSAISESTPERLEYGQWHMPFGNDIDIPSSLNIDSNDALLHTLLKVSTARCARISYQTVGDNPKIDYEADISLHDNLLESGHFSPFEHCARAMSDEEYISFTKGDINDIYDEGGWCNNYKGFIQYRYLIENNLKI